MRLRGEAMGFLILTGLLSLAFIVSIVYAYTSEGGWAEEVNWSVSVSTNYNSVEKKTYSYHSIWVYNNRCEENGYPSPKIDIHYDFEHLIEGLAWQGYITLDSGWINDIPSKESAYYSNTLSLDVSGLEPKPEGYKLNAYTRLEVYASDGDKINLQTYPENPDIDGEVYEDLDFNTE